MAMYLKSAGGNWSAAATWSATSSAGVDSVGPPLASTDAILELGSGAVTIDVASVCRSLDTTSGVGTYGGTLTHNAFTLSIGDGTAGAGNVALKLNSGMTYSPVAGSSIILKSTSATQQTVTLAGKSPVGFQVNGAGSSYQLQDNLTLTGNFTYSAGTTFDTNSKSIILSGATPTFGGSTKTYFDVQLTGSGAGGLNGVCTFGSLTRTGTATQTDSLTISNNFTVTGTLTFNGNSTSNRLRVISGAAGTQITITLTGATVTGQYFNLTDIAASGATPNISAVTGGSGDGGNNSGFTFTTPQTNYWVADTGTWTDVANHWANSSGGTAGTGRIPLIQDTARFDSASFTTSGRNVSGMLQLFGSVDWTGVTNNPTWTISGVLGNSYSTYGSITLISGMNITIGAATGNFIGRGANTLTSAGKSFTTINISVLGGSVTLLDALTCTGNLAVLSGGFVSSGFNITISAFISSGVLIRSVNINSSNVTINLAAATIWNVTSSGMTFTGTTSTITIPSSASNQAFNGGGVTGYGTLAIVGGGAGIITISGSNTWSNLPQITGGTKTVLFTSGTTQTFTSGTSFGNGTNVVTLNAVTAASPFTFSMAAGTVSADWLSLKDSTASGGAAWYAGANSTNTSGNTGWIFTAPPAGGGSNFFFS